MELFGIFRVEIEISNVKLRNNTVDQPRDLKDDTLRAIVNALLVIQRHQPLSEN